MVSFANAMLRASLNVGGGNLANKFFCIRSSLHPQTILSRRRFSSPSQNAQCSDNLLKEVTKSVIDSPCFLDLL